MRCFELARGFEKGGGERGVPLGTLTPPIEENAHSFESRRSPGSIYVVLAAYLSKEDGREDGMGGEELGMLEDGVGVRA